MTIDPLADEIAGFTARLDQVKAKGRALEAAAWPTEAVDLVLDDDVRELERELERIHARLLD